MPISWINRILAVFLIGLSAWFYTMAMEFPLNGDIFPKFVLALIILLSALLFIQSFLDKQRGTTGTEKLEGMDKIRPYLVFGACLIYILLIHFIGFFPATVLTTLFLMPILDVKRRVLYLSIAAVVMLFIFILFVGVLHVPLPKGVIFS